MKNFVLFLAIGCCVFGCHGKDPVSVDSSASAVVTAEAVPTVVPTVSATSPAVTGTVPVSSVSANLPVDKK